MRGDVILPMPFVFFIYYQLSFNLLVIGRRASCVYVCAAEVMKSSEKESDNLFSSSVKRQSGNVFFCFFPRPTFSLQAFKIAPLHVFAFIFISFGEQGEEEFLNGFERQMDDGDR